jgi:hypothetical protein
MARKPPLLGEPRVTKLGRLIHTFSIPALETCPGKSPLCSSLCYAGTGFFVMKSVADKHWDNYWRTRTAEFVDDVVTQVKEDCVRHVRIHVAGDFYDLAYTGKWIQVVRRCFHTVFFAYTRSWTSKSMLLALKTLAGLKNMHLWFSADRTMPRPPRVPGIRIAYLLAPDEDPAGVPSWADLVFRDEVDVPMKRAGGVLVCPYEQGIKRTVKLTCSQCGICFSQPRKAPTHDQETHQPDPVRIRVRRPRRVPAGHSAGAAEHRDQHQPEQ